MPRHSPSFDSCMKGGITTSFINKANRPSLQKLLVRNGKEQSLRVKARLIEEGIKKHQCEQCGLDAWNEEPIPLELHHINGVPNDHRITNLKILCCNCHAQTRTYCGRNTYRSNNNIREVLK